MKTALKRFWNSGWLFAFLFATLAAYEYGLVSQHERNLIEIDRLTTRLEVVQSEQQKINESYINAWQNQQETAKLILVYVEFIKTRFKTIEKYSGPQYTNYGR